MAGPLKSIPQLKCVNSNNFQLTVTRYITCASRAVLFFRRKSTFEQSKLKYPQGRQFSEGTVVLYETSQVCGFFSMVFNLHRVTIVTRELAKKLSGYIYYQISTGHIGNLETRARKCPQLFKYYIQIVIEINRFVYFI